MKYLIFALLLIIAFPVFAEQTSINFDGDTWEKQTAPTDTIAGHENAWYCVGSLEWIHCEVDTYTVYHTNNGIHIQDAEDRYSLLWFLITGLN